MKRILLILTLLISLTLVAESALALSTGLEYGSYTGLGTQDLRASVMGIIRILFGFLGVLAITGIVFGGVLIMISGGNQRRTGTGKMAITAGVIGLIIIFSAYAIASFVINQLISATGAN